MTSNELMAMLRLKYKTGEWSILTEVRDKAGFNATRAADAVAFNLWPARGHVLHGFEIKVSRNDWVRELAKPDKAFGVMKYCHYWYVIVADAKIVHPGELPATWGLMAPVKNKGLVVQTPAPKLTPEPLTPTFIACLLKRATDGMVPASIVEDAVKIKVQAALENGARDSLGTIKHYEDQYKRLAEDVRQFELQTGVTFRHNLPNLRYVFDLIRNGEIVSLRRSLDNYLPEARHLVSVIERHQAALAKIGDNPLAELTEGGEVPDRA